MQKSSSHTAPTVSPNVLLKQLHKVNELRLTENTQNTYMMLHLSQNYASQKGFTLISRLGTALNIVTEAFTSTMLCRLGRISRQIIWGYMDQTVFGDVIVFELYGQLDWLIGSGYFNCGATILIGTPFLVRYGLMQYALFTILKAMWTSSFGVLLLTLCNKFSMEKHHKQSKSNWKPLELQCLQHQTSAHGHCISASNASS